MGLSFYVIIVQYPIFKFNSPKKRHKINMIKKHITDHIHSDIINLRTSFIFFQYTFAINTRLFTESATKGN